MIAPKWCKDAVPTLRGWAHPVTGELFVSKRFTQEQIDAFHGVEEVVEEVQPEPVVEVLTEAPANHRSLQDMTKAELKALAEQLGVEVSRYATKKTLVEQLS